MSEYEVGALDADIETDDSSSSYSKAEYFLGAFGAEQEEGPWAHDEVPEAGWNRWLLTSYFPTVPEAYADSFSPDHVSFSVTPQSDDFGGGLYIDQRVPKDDYSKPSIFSPTMSVGYGLGPISFSATSISVDPRDAIGDPVLHQQGFDSDYDEYWEYQVDEWPDTPMNSAGVRFNVNANEGMSGTHSMKIESEFGYYFKPLLTSVGTYSELDATPSLDCTFTVVDSDQAPQVGDYSPTDPDGDGQYEDVNGDGTVSNADITTFFSKQHTPAWKDRTDLFDFDRNGRVGQSDVIELFEEVVGN